MPPMPESLERHRVVSLGRMRSRAVGGVRDGMPEVVVVMGMAVADYLMPAVAVLGSWTRAHLVELPGFAGSGDPPRELSVPELVLRGREDRILSRGWADHLARLRGPGKLVELPGAHTFPWPAPAAWSEPLRRLALDVGDRRR